MPHSLVTIIWTLIDSIITKKIYFFSDLILAIIGFDFKRIIDSSMWYITFILIMYIIFYIAFKLPVRDIIKVFILFLCAYIFNRHLSLEYTKSITYQFILHSYGFPIGVLISLYIKKITNVFKPKTLIIGIGIFTIFILIAYIYSLMNINSRDYYNANSIVFALILLSIFILLSIVNIKFKLPVYLGAAPNLLKCLE